MSWVTRPRVYAYSIISTFAAFATVAVAFSERSNFYASVVFLGRSNGCLLVLLNFLLVIALVVGRILQLVYFGQLRRSEVELVCERSWYSLVGTLLAVSIFRDDFSVSFVILFGVLLFLKIFHWLSAERVASIMQSPSVPHIFHARMISIMFTLLLADLLLVGFSMHMLLVKKVKMGMMVLFTSEFIILTALLCNTVAQYILNCIDMAREEPWEAKSLYVLYFDLAHDLVRLCTHGYFFVLLTRLYGIPLSLIHDLYSAGRSCMTKITALVRYRQAVKKMETKYPNATVADLQATDGTCIICREDMVATDLENGASDTSNAATAAAAVVTSVTPKKLSCGHIFHFRCLRSWLERQQSCPTCRRMILDDGPEPITQQPPVAPPFEQQQQQNQPLQPEAGADVPPETQRHNAATEPASSAAHTPWVAEQNYDTRLQGFINRLQSDLRKVREEGDRSARQASSSARRRTSRSGHSTPRRGLDPLPPPKSVFGSELGRYASPKLFSTQMRSNDSQVQSEVSEAGGLWMPPPPSTLYMNGRPQPRQQVQGNGVALRPDRVALSQDAESPHEGKGKAKAQDPDSGSDTDTDPVDPREAIRQATLKRFPPSATATGSTHFPSKVAADTPSPIGMIPLFDPSSIPDFSTTHLPSLPHPLLSSSSSAPPTNLNRAGSEEGADLRDVLKAKTRGIEHQIALLVGIQTRIDGVITDLTKVLDAVGSTATPEAAEPTGTASNCGAGAEETSQ